MNTIVELKAGDYYHAFTPEFSWIVFAVLAGVIVLAYFLAKSETRINSIKVNDKGQKVFTVLYANTPTRLAYTILSFIACEAIIVREHGDGIYQWELNHSGAAADEIVVLFATLFFIGVFASIYSVIVYKVFGLGSKVSLILINMVVRKNDGILNAHEYLDIAHSIKQTFKSTNKNTARKTVVKRKSSIPAGKTRRVATRTAV